MAPMQASLSSNEISRSQHASPAVAATLWAERPPSGSGARRAGHILSKFFALQARNLRGCGPPFSSRSEGLRPAQEVADHAAGDHLPHDWGEVAHGAQEAAGLAPLLVGDLLHADGLLVRVEDLQVVDAAAPALLAHDARERAVDRLLYAGEPEPGGVELVTAAHGGNLAVTALLAPDRQLQLLGHGVDGVHHVVRAGEGRQRLVYAVLGEKRLDRGDAGLGVDVQHHGARHVGLGAADGAGIGHGLAIDVAGRNHVAVEQHQVAHAAAGERLHAVGANAAQANDHDAGPVEPREPLLAQNEPQPVLGRLRLRHAVLPLLCKSRARCCPAWAYLMPARAPYGAWRARAPP